MAVLAHEYERSYIGEMVDNLVFSVVIDAELIVCDQVYAYL